jgi:hypothetical protein
LPTKTTKRAKVQVELDMAEIIRPALVRALHDMGELEAQATVARLSVPVGRNAGGGVDERSKPGEFPRMEHGILRANVEYEVDPAGANGMPEMTLSATRPPENPGDDPDAARILQDGMNRPILHGRPDAAYEQLRENAGDITAAHLSALGR